MGNGLSIAELSILDWIALHCHSGFGDTVMPLFSKIANLGLIWIAVGFSLLFFVRNHRSTGVQVLLALILSVLLCNLLLKNLVGRIRPCDLKPVLDLLVSRPDDPSFPSGHTSASFAVVTVLWRKKCPGWWAALLLAFLIAFSRLYLYVHFPTDVLCGLIIGILCGFLSTLLWDRFLAPKAPGWFRNDRDTPP